MLPFGRVVLFIANMHLANVNKHRAVSLQTLQRLSIRQRKIPLLKMRWCSKLHAQSMRTFRAAILGGRQPNMVATAVCLRLFGVPIERPKLATEIDGSLNCFA